MTLQAHGPRAAVPAPPASMSWIATASFVGTTIEFFDFFVYGTAAALVFGPVFFPALGDHAGSLASFATYAVAFVARPAGALIFGHVGDRLGRKRTLITTLLLMGLATFVIGLVPGAGRIGVAAPILLVVLRLLQGLGLGGEWAGAALLVAEHAPAERRGFYGMFPQLGPGIAFSLASLTFLISAVSMSPESFVAWGWRIPFLLSIVLVAVGLYMRLRIEETPVFRKAVEQRALISAPVVDVLRREARTILLGGGLMTSLLGLFYIGAVYLSSYSTLALGHERTDVLTIGVISGAVFAVFNAASAAVSDRVGRRSVLIVGNAVTVVWALALFPIIDSGSLTGLAIGVFGTLGIVGFCYGPVAAYLPELFPTRYRYTAAGASYALGGILGGAIPPIVATELQASYGTAAIGWFLAALGVLSTLCAVLLADSRRTSLDGEPAPLPA